MPTNKNEVAPELKHAKLSAGIAYWSIMGGSSYLFVALTSWNELWPLHMGSWGWFARALVGVMLLALAIGWTSFESYHLEKQEKKVAERERKDRMQ